VTVILHTSLQKRSVDGKALNHITVTLPDGASIADLLLLLEISMSIDDLILAVNHRAAEPTRILGEQDTIDIIPAISGGAENGRGEHCALQYLKFDSLLKIRYT
jgi:sulfur carrier protein ThiS